MREELCAKLFFNDNLNYFVRFILFKKQNNLDYDKN